MRVRVTDPARLDDLVEFLRDRMHCAVAVEEDGLVLVSIPKSLNDEAEPLELDVYLSAWEKARSGAAAERVE